MTTSSTVRGTLRWVGSVLAWVVLLAVLAVLLASVAVPRLAGATPYTVLTGSMQPAFPPGTLLIVRPVNTATLGVGDVVTYQLKSGQPEVVTHRIESVSLGQRGDNVFVTKGDANRVADIDPVRAVQIRGQVWYGVPFVGYLTTWSTGPLRVGVFGVAVVALLIYAAINFGGTVRDRRTRRLARRAEPGAAS